MNRALFFFLLSLLLSSLVTAQELTIPFSPAPNQPFLVTPQLNIDSADLDTIILTIKAEKSGTARLFWANHYDPQFNQPKSVWFSYKPGWKQYVFNVPSQNPNWIGWVGGLLVYPEAGLSGFEIAGAQAVHGNLGTNIRSAWQEFWGPNGRMVVGSTINVTPASAIFGRPVNIYIYWLTALFFLAAFAWKREFFTAGKLTIYFVLGAWVVLGLSTYTNYWRNFQDNFGKYFGKSIDEKRALAYGRDYYDFLVFARDKLPKQPVNFGVLSGRYAPDLQARIFLVPHILVDPASGQADYLLVFNPEPKQLELAKGFSSFISLSKNAYILKRSSLKQKGG